MVLECINIVGVDLHVAGIMDLPMRTILLSLRLDFAERVAVVRSLLEAAGIPQLDDDLTCVCGDTLTVPGDDRALVPSQRGGSEAPIVT